MYNDALVAGFRVPRRCRIRVIVSALAVVATLFPPALRGQGAASRLAARCDEIGGLTEPLHLNPERLAELEGARDPMPRGVTRPGVVTLRCRLKDMGGAALVPLPVAAGLRINSSYPVHALDGVVWAGQGFTADLRFGAGGRWGPFSAAFAPVIAYQENGDFPIEPVERTGSSRYAYPWLPTAIDLPQRFGRDAFFVLDPGESFVRADVFGIGAGFSTEAVRWGPARRNPLLMSGAAGGFPHVFLGTSGPTDVWIGRLSLEAVWGHLSESDYFDFDPANDTRVLAGLVGAFQPRGLSGLSVGFARAYLRTLPPGGWDPWQYLSEPFGGWRENRGGQFSAENQLLSVFGRWVLPGSRAEIYAELARDDAWDGFDDLLAEPEHSMAYTLGFQKLMRVSKNRVDLRLAVEAVSSNSSETQRSGRPEAIFYTHSVVRQGYTHRGQLLGSPVGPAGDGQFLELDLLANTWLAGFHLRRVRYANDIYWQAFAPRYGYHGHDVEITGGLRGALPLSRLGIDLVGDLSWSSRNNRDFLTLTEPFFVLSHENNVSLQLRASWTPASRRTAGAGDPASPLPRP